ncbi:penicillin-binding protein 1C [Sphingobacteriales bacterium TSM_CSS]|nr:penicillin-binding protein 1C [Sphingobacteriales bacterium TSM_CSS]
MSVQQKLIQWFEQQLHKCRRNERLLFAACALYCMALFADMLLPPQSTKVEYSQIITDKEDNILYAFLTRDDKWRMMTELNEITPELRKAIVFKEDKYFYFHYGINPVAIVRAAVNNMAYGKRTSGASTITMQVARLLQPKKRTYGNKTIEILRALQLEWHYSKLQILQLYLNLVPYGSNIEGVKSASVLYFNKMPNHLSLAEITALSIIPNRPTSLQIGKNNAQLTEARNKWLQRFARARLFTKDAIDDALLEPFNAGRLEAPKLAPHFAWRMKDMFPDMPIVKTNLRYNTQLKTETMVSNYIKRLYYQHIRNAAVVVLNNRTMEVEAYVGSADFLNTEDGGQVDGVKALRSPGSALKPYLYALAFDKGVVTPKLKVSDVPSNFSGYTPVNFDGTYNGSVTIEDALAYSLNIPAVKVLNELGVNYFVDQLSKAGFGQVQADRSKMGLSLALGGCGVRLEELVKLYAAFANKGLFYPVRWLKNEPADTGSVRLFSEQAAYVITENLTRISRPDLPKSIESSKSLPKIAWKTGTSYGRKDAWSIGYNANYTIGVWVGNFSGEGVPELGGAVTATPLLFEIFNTVNYSPGSDWFAPPENLEYRWVCSETGLLPQPDCNNRVMDYYLPMISTNKMCHHQQEVFVSADSSFTYCTACLPETGYKKKKYPLYPPEIVAFYEQQGIPYEKIPPHNPNCDRLFSGNAPRITSPVNGLEYLLDPLDNTELMLTCNTSNDVQLVHWYINELYLQPAPPTGKLFFTPKPGRNKITCVDDKGRKEQIWITAKFL